MWIFITRIELGYESSLQPSSAILLFRNIPTLKYGRLLHDIRVGRAHARCLHVRVGSEVVVVRYCTHSEARSVVIVDSEVQSANVRIIFIYA